MVNKVLGVPALNYYYKFLLARVIVINQLPHFYDVVRKEEQVSSQSLHYIIQCKASKILPNNRRDKRLESL